MKSRNDQRTSTKRKERGAPARNRDDSPAASAAPQKLAEWVTTGVSVLIILAVAGYLIHLTTLPESPHVAVQVRPLLQEARTTGDRFALPIELANPSRQTLQDVQAEVSWQSADGQPRRYEFKLDYIGERETQKVFVVLDRDPSTANVQARPLGYRVR